MIDGVTILDLKTHGDERGFFREIVRFPDQSLQPLQESHAVRHTGIANGWHIHRHHTETFYVVTGTMRLVLKDCRIGKPILVDYPYESKYREPVVFGVSKTPLEYTEVYLGENIPRTVKVPAGVAHGYKIISGNCHIIYTATATYETSRLDEGRIAWDFWKEHDWTRGVETK